jgi:hypothetical protein
VERYSIGHANFLKEGLSGEEGLPIFAPCNHQTKEVIQCLIVIPYGVPAIWISFPAGFRPKGAPNDDNAKGRVREGAAFLFAFAVEHSGKKVSENGFMLLSSPLSQGILLYKLSCSSN